MQAECNIAGSYIEPFSIQELTVLESTISNELINTSMHYPGTQGSESLRLAVARRYALKASQVVLTEGTDGAINSVYKAIIRPGAKVIVQVPAYEPLLALPKLMGAEVIPWQSEECAHWSPSLDQLEELLQQGADALVINVPHNPTGWMPDETFCERLIQLCDRSDTQLIVDEVYLGLPDNKVFKSFAERSESAVIVGGLSKAFGMPGLRIGWTATKNDQLTKNIKSIRTFGNTFISSLSETIALAVFKHESAILKRNTEARQKGFQQLQNFMEQYQDWFCWVPPQGGVTGYLRLVKHSSAQSVAKELLASYSTLVVPSSLFDHDDRYLRVGFGLKNLPKALERLADFAKN